ncbi:predicted protein [Nematostella vectensis]|uniref:Uncharacterized protein n=1 Tax=Nematostella vectensis TaxID=45351 RepID=A7RW71_NEMVE|nr:predicted protein [Nematostella vectensis]|eukprot:XP_001636278.1 predicted protein [Nematostella vectensis]
MELIAGAAACCILDLIVLGKLSVEVLPGSTLGISTKDVIVKVIDEKPTHTYLDKAIFDAILDHHRSNPDKPKKLRSWILMDLNRIVPKTKCATVTLDSLADIGILCKKESTFSIKYPTLNPGIQENLLKELQEVGYGREPASYMRALLTIMRTVDNLLLCWDPLLKKQFPKEKYAAAKERIKALVQVSEDNEKKYEKMD